LQFHMEADAALIERWLKIPAYREELEAAGLGHDAAAIRAATSARLAQMVQPVPGPAGQAEPETDAAFARRRGVVSRRSR
jgi:hypothetical protein